MPQPVQPPETPAIIQPVTTNDAVTLEQASIEAPGARLSRSLSSGTIPKPTPPEAFAPEFSPLRAYKSAALLGPPISVGYSRPSPEAPSIGEAVEQQSDRSQSFSSSAALSPPTRSFPPVLVSEANTLQASASSNVSPSDALSVTLGTQNVKRLVTQERGGEAKEFEFSIPNPETQPSPEEEVAPTPNEDEVNPQPPSTPTPTPNVPDNPFGTGGVIELTADRQEYDDQRKVITAQGNVVLRFREALLNADRVEVNLPNRIIVAQGNVALTRGQQVLRGQRFEYYFVQDSGVILNASGELYSPTAGSDLSFSPTPGSTAPPPSDR